MSKNNKYKAKTISISDDGVTVLAKKVKIEHNEVIFPAVLLATAVMVPSAIITAFLVDSFAIAMIFYGLAFALTFLVTFNIMLTKEIRYALETYSEKVPMVDGLKINSLSCGTTDLGTSFVSSSHNKKNSVKVIGQRNYGSMVVHDVEVNTKLIVHPFGLKLVETRTPLAGAMWDDALESALGAYEFKEPPMRLSSYNDYSDY